MTIQIRRLIQLALGVAAGLTAWPVMELLIHEQSRFQTFLSYATASGASFGLIFGLFVGSAEGMIASRTRRVFIGALSGALIGAAGGAAGFLAGQGVLFIVGDRLTSTIQQVNRIALPIGRAVGWAILGAFVGAAGGIRVVSVRKASIGALGGFAGGILGGAAAEYARVLFVAAPIARLIGLLFLGLTIGLAYAWVEGRLAFGVLRVLNGPFKRREFILNQRRMTIGSRQRCDIPIPEGEGSGPRRGYAGVAGVHCRIVSRGRQLYLHPMEGAVRLNDQVVSSRAETLANQLKYDDVIACGGAKFLFSRV